MNYKTLLGLGLALGVLVTAGWTHTAQTPVSAERDANGDYRFRWLDVAGKPQEFVFVPADKILPRVTSQVSTLARQYVYEYAIRNEASAEQKISLCFADITLPTKIDRTPAGWRAMHPTDVIPRVAWASNILVGNSRAGIERGNEVNGFRVVSTNLPGVTEFACFSDADPTPVPGDLPSFVLSELAQLPLNNDGVRVPIIGPVISLQGSPSVLATSIAQHYWPAIASSAHPNKDAIVGALAELIQVASVGDRRDLPGAVDAVNRALANRPLDRWALELSEGLSTCLSYLSARLRAA